MVHHCADDSWPRAGHRVLAKGSLMVTRRGGEHGRVRYQQALVTETTVLSSANT